MLSDILLGALFGAVVIWGAFLGLFDQFTETRGQRLRSLPKSFWRRSAVGATVGGVLGAVIAWMLHGGLQN
jgi:hypothetical protein